MALKLIIVLFAAVVYVSAEDKPCTCPSEPTDLEINNIIEFFRNLPAKVENIDDYPVIPGELSPLLPCSCNENDRKKRTIFEPQKTDVKLPSYSRPRPRHDEARNRCPLGYQRIAFMCVPL